MLDRLKILMSGGTGFLGTQVCAELRSIADIDVISRSAKDYLRGDLQKWDAGLDLPILRKKKYDIFLHLAGLYDLSATHCECFLNNVAATGTALKVSRELGIPVFINASSVAAGFNSTLPTVKPYDLNFSQAFPDAYSESKALVEQILINWQEHFRLIINLRFGVLVGDSQTGSIQRIDGPYHSADALQKLKGILNRGNHFLLPGIESRRLPLVPVDAAARAVLGFVKWSQVPSQKAYRSFHLTPAEGLSTRSLYQSTLQFMGFSDKKIHLMGRFPQKLLASASQLTLGLPEEEMKYLLGFPIYDSKDTQDILGTHWCPEFKDYEQAFWQGYNEYISHR